MATIALYAGRINQVSGQVSGAKKAVGSLKTQLDTLKKKCEKVNASVCNIDDVIRSISASTRTQEAKAEMLETLAEDIDEFVDHTVNTDEKVADKIESNKDDFYDKYSYLKPECEKSWFEKAKKCLKKVGKWCKEHWKAAITIVLVAIAIIVIIVTGGTAATPLALLALAVAKGALIGAAIGGLAGGIMSVAFGKSFWEGFEDGAFGGVLSGMISGGWQHIIGELTLKMAGIIGAVSEGISSIIGDVGDMIMGTDDISGCEFVINTALAFGLGRLSGRITFELPKIRIDGINKGIGSWAHVWATQSTRSLNHHTIISIKTILKGLGADFVEDTMSHISELIKSLIGNIKDLTVETVKAGGSAG